MIAELKSLVARHGWLLVAGAALLAKPGLASANCHPALRLSPGSHGSNVPDPRFREGIARIENKMARNPHFYDWLGCPIGNFGVARDGGAFIPFEHGGVYAEPGRPDAYEIHGPLYYKWAEMGYEHGALGWPRSDVIHEMGLARSILSGGQVWLYSKEPIGPFAIYGDIHLSWNEALWPQTDEYYSPGHALCPAGFRMQEFIDLVGPEGYLSACWNPSTRWVSFFPTPRRPAPWSAPATNSQGLAPF